MFDSTRRNIHYLRLSVTDLCNLRCRYCMPDGVEKLEREGDRLLLHRRLETGVEVLSARGPLVVSVCEYAYHLRLPGILSMRRARGKTVERYSAADLGLTAEQCGLKGSLTKVTAMESKFPGLRNGPKETDPAEGLQALRAILREVQP